MVDWVLMMNLMRTGGQPEGRPCFIYPSRLAKTISTESRNGKEANRKKIKKSSNTRWGSARLTKVFRSGHREAAQTPSGGTTTEGMKIVLYLQAMATRAVEENCEMLAEGVGCQAVFMCGGGGREKRTRCVFCKKIQERL